ncbi:MAG: TPM domain-containing protein [Myxococcota bacterium]
MTRLAVALALLGVSAAPVLKKRVTDQAGILTYAQETQLTARLESYRRDSGHGFSVLTVKSTAPESFEDFANSLSSEPKLGDPERALLLVVSREQEQIEVIVGAKLRPLISESLAAQVVEAVVAPAFRAGDYGAGIAHGLELLMQAGAGDSVDLNTGWTSAPSQKASGKDMSVIAAIVVVFLVILVGSVFWGGRRRGSRTRRHNPVGGSSATIGKNRFGGGGASGNW